MRPTQYHHKFKDLYDAALAARYDTYWADPRINSAGGVESPDDYEQNVWMLDAFEEAADKLGCKIEEHRDVSDCYHLVRLVAVHPKLGPIAGLEYVDCVCGDHGPRNAELFWPKGVER